MEQVAGFATTAEGEQLVKLAVQLVRTEWHPIPIWLAPIEPFRWFVSLISTGYPHAKWLAVTYLSLSLVASVAIFRLSRTKGWQRLAIAFIAGCNVLLTFSGGYIAVEWLESVTPFGMRWVVPGNAPFVLANLHTHTTQSNGFLTPEQAVLWHLWHGYKIIAITDSNTVKGGEIARDFVRRAKLPVTVLVGEEFRGKTHLVMLNIRSDISPRKFDVPAAIKEAKKQGGIVIAAHPWSSKHSVYELLRWGVDGFEITNGSVLGNEKLRSLCREHKRAPLGSLDFRSGCSPETATVLPIWANSPQKVAKALREGHCAVIYFPQRVSVGGFEFNPLKSWLDEIENLWRTSGISILVGTAFWAIIAAWLWKRRKKSEEKKRRDRRVWHWWKFVGVCAVVFSIFMLSTGLGVWAMARDLKRSWFPPIPLVIAVWAIACVVNWLLWVQLVTAKLSPDESMPVIETR